jgi:hypothetical protein
MIGAVKPLFKLRRGGRCDAGPQAAQAVPATLGGSA